MPALEYLELARIEAVRERILLTSMGRLSKALAMLLLVTVAAAAAPAEGWATPAPPHQRLGGCHEQAPPTPAPTPADYKCCLAGHGLAIVQESAAPRPVQLYVAPATHFIPASAPVTGATSLRSPLSLSGDPPGVTPLRI